VIQERGTSSRAVIPVGLKNTLLILSCVDLAVAAFFQPMKIKSRVIIVGFKKKRISDAATAFGKDFSLRTRNALLGAGLDDQKKLHECIRSGKIFNTPRLGPNGIKEVITWAWSQFIDPHGKNS
jgi:hypothetical protein